MPTLEYFMESLTQEQDKFIKMRIIKSTKDQSIITSVLNQVKGNNNTNDSKQQQNNKQEKPKLSDGGLNPSKDKGKKQEKTKYTYCHKGWHPKSACMKNTTNMIAKFLEKSNIPLMYGTKKKDGGSNSKTKER